MFYYVYQLTNTVNGKTYIGAHQTPEPVDNYMGSGIAIRRAVSKYGKEAFTKTILHECQSEADMYSKERELVTPEFVARSDTYNMTCGGNGGFSHIKQAWNKGIPNPQLAQRNRLNPVRLFGDDNPARKPGVMDCIKGENNPAKRPEVRMKLRAQKTEEHKRKIGLANVGRKHPDLALRNRLRKSLSINTVDAPIESVVNGQQTHPHA